MEQGKGGDVKAISTGKPIEQGIVSNSKPEPPTTSETAEVFDGTDDSTQALLTTITPPQRSTIFKGSFIEYWWKEIIASGIMLCSLMAIILILALHQNRPLPNWPFTITLNSLISIMTIILKSSMLAIVASGLSQTKWLWFERSRPLLDYMSYDISSQGPLNASKLLWILRGKQIIACVGLLVVIVAMAIEPFTQQVIQYYDSTIPLDVAGNATLPRTTVYFDGGAHIGAGEFTIDNPMLGAVMAGFWTPSSDKFTVSASNCITGNCTFAEPYESIGICSACSDLTDKVSGFCGGSMLDCNYTLPTGTTLSTSGSNRGQRMVANFSSADTPGSFPGREFVWINDTCKVAACPVSAATCHLYPCIKTYTAEISNGILQEKVLSSIPIPGSPPCQTSLKKGCLTPNDWALLSSQGIHPRDDPGSDYILYCNNETPTPTQFTNTCVFGFAYFSYSSIEYLFIGGGAVDQNLFLYGSLVGDASTNVIGPPDLSYLYNTGNVTVASIVATFNNLAQTMTARIRVDGYDNYSTPAQGVISYKQTLIRVKWRWMTLPLALVVLTLLFIVTVIIQTSINSRKPLGEAFLLRLLYTGVAGHVSDQFPDLRRHQEAALEKIEEVQIQMRKIEGDGWRLLKL